MLKGTNLPISHIDDVLLTDKGEISLPIFRGLNSVLRLLYEEEQPQNTYWAVLCRIMSVLV